MDFPNITMPIDATKINTAIDMLNGPKDAKNWYPAILWRKFIFLFPSIKLIFQRGETGDIALSNSICRSCYVIRTNLKVHSL